MKGSFTRQSSRTPTRVIRTAILTAVGVVALPLFSQDQAKATLFWDSDASPSANNTSTGANLGGTGAWGTSSNWYDGVVETTWTAGADAVFFGAPGTVTLASPQSASNLTFKTSGYNLTGSTVIMTPTAPTFTVDTGVIATIASTLSGTGTMTKLGGGALALTNSFNTNTAVSGMGGWLVNAGTLLVNNDGNFGISPGSGVTDLQINQSTIQAATNFTFDQSRRTKINTNGTTNLGDAIIDVNQFNVTWFGSIQGGPGTLRVTDHNANGGMLILGTDKIASINPWGSTLPAGTVNLTIENHVVVQTSGTVTPTGGELGSETGAGGAPLAILLQTGGQLRAESGGYEFQRNLILGPGGGSCDSGAWSQTFLGTVSGTGSLSKFGTGSLVLDNPSATWAGGTFIHNGTLQLGRGGSNGLLPGTLANPSSVVIDAGATLEFLRGSNKSFFDQISGGGGILVANSNNAKVRLVSSNTYTGLTTITSGILMIGQGNPGEPGSIVSDVLDNATLDFNRVEDITYSGRITGSGVVTKEAAGALTLTSSNSYSGGTSVLAGKLIVANTSGSATGSGNVSVSSGATLAGSGAVAGTVGLPSGAHLAPGASSDVLTLGGLSLSPGSQLDYELGTPASSDQTAITNPGALSLTGGTLNIASLPGFGVGQYVILDYAGSFTGSATNLSIGSAPPGFTYSFVDNPSTSSVDLVVAVPEPITLFWCAPVIVLLTSRRRRRDNDFRLSR